MLETASPSVIWYFARPGSALAMLSRFFSSIAVTEFSFSSVGANLLSLSCTNPDSCLATADVLASSSTISCRRVDQHLEQIVGVEDQLVDLLAAFGQDPGDIAGTLEQLAQGFVAAVEGSRQPGQPVEGRAQLRCDLVERRRQRVQRLVQRSRCWSRRCSW